MQTKPHLPITLIIIAAIVIIVALFLPTQGLSKAPNISLHYIDGQKVDFDSFKGNPLLVTFWSTTCATCIKEMPHLVKLYEELNKDGLQIVGIAMPYDPPNIVVEISEKINVSYPIALDIEGVAMKAFGNISVTPTSFLIDADGNIVEQKTGAMDIKQLKIKVKELLATPTTTVS